MLKCTLCGNNQFNEYPILEPALICQWELSQREIDYINKQQGKACSVCNSSLRIIALAKAMLAHMNSEELLIDAIKRRPDRKVLEINAAGDIAAFLQLYWGYEFCSYPSVDMQNMPFESNRYDFVIHSDTLEHVEDPRLALKECLRILKPHGALCFTVPIIVDRMTRSRKGMEKSYHGFEKEDYMVHTEFGIDVPNYLFEAGFKAVSLHAVEYPAGLAVCGVK